MTRNREWFFAKCARCGSTDISTGDIRCNQCGRHLDEMDTGIDITSEPECPRCNGSMHRVDCEVGTKLVCGWCYLEQEEAGV